MTALSPQPNVVAAHQFVESSSLREALLEYVSGQGLPWLQGASDQQICSSLAAASNATVSMSARIGSMSCDPPPDAAEVTLTIRLRSKLVVLEAWYNAKA